MMRKIDEQIHSTLWELLNRKIVVAAYGKRFYWHPKRLTLKCNPAIYRWGYWNF